MKQSPPKCFTALPLGACKLDQMNDRVATFTTWKKYGHDRHSVIADPMFVDPQNDDYRLKPESPAHRLGFRPIDVSAIGVRRGPLGNVRQN